MGRLHIQWSDGRVEDLAVPESGHLEIGSGAMLCTVPLYRPDGETLATVAVHGGELPLIIYRGAERCRPDA